MNQPEPDIFDRWRPALLVMMTLAGAGLGMATSILVARYLGPGAFEHYAVAVASVGLLATLAEAGVGKYSLKVLPRFLAAQRWPDAAGFLRFSFSLVVLAGLLLGGISIAWEGLEDREFGDHPFGIAVLFLPAVALSGALIDLVMATRAPILGSVIARVVVPGSTLVVLLLLVGLGTLTPLLAVICFEMGSVIGVGACLLVLYRRLDQRVWSAKPRYRVQIWLGQSAWFALSAFLGSWLLRVPIIAIEFLSVPESEVAHLVAAMELGCLVLLLAKSTDKLYQPEMSLVIEQQDAIAGNRLRWRRMLFIGSGCGLFLATMVVFGRSLLDLYGPGYRAGYVALLLAAVGASVATLFSLTPAYMRFVGKHRFVVGCEILASLSLVFLVVLLGTWYGASGAAAAFCLVVVALFAVISTRAIYHFSRSTS